MRVRHRRGSKDGYVLIGVLILVAIAGIITSGSLNFSTSTLRTTHALEVRDREFFSAEDSLSRGVAWLRDYSTSMINVFGREEFKKHFVLTAPSFGNNDNTQFKLPTRVKLVAGGGVDSAMLTSNSLLGVSKFPNTIDTYSALGMNPASLFRNAKLGVDGVRITLIDAVPKDYNGAFNADGSLKEPLTTDFYPVYRIDALRLPERGGHVFSYVIGDLVTTSSFGFYGRDLLDISQKCDSYISDVNNKNYTAARRRANCTTGSEKNLLIGNNKRVFGSAKSNGKFVRDDSKEPVCADFKTPCTPGVKCAGTEGGTCRVPQLPTYKPWNEYCPTQKAAVNGVNNVDKIVTIASNAPADRCFSALNISGKTQKITLKTTAYSYFVDTLTLPNNNGGLLNFAPDTTDGTINLYVRKFSDTTINASSVMNLNNRPAQLRIHYLGTEDLKINGNSAMNAFIIAPYANITVQGNNDFAGGIKAKELVITGSADVHYDESGDIENVSDVVYKVRNFNQYNR